MSEENIYFAHKRGSMFKHEYELTFAGKRVGNTVTIGIAVCSKSDHFNKKAGREKAVERLTYAPTFSFPSLHKKASRSVYYWFRALGVNTWGRPNKEIKDHVTRIQREFDKTVLGIRLKMNHDAEEIIKKKDK